MMRKNCDFKMNPAYIVGLILMCAGLTIRHGLELDLPVAELLCGAGAGLSLVGLLAGAPKTRPLFDKLRAFKARLLGRGA